MMMMIVIIIIVIIHVTITYFCAKDLKLKSKVNATVSIITINPLLSPPPPLHVPSILILYKKLKWTDRLWFIQAGNSYCFWSSAA